ncbi:MAG: PPOX class F420-dependent oxidoreductase [Chloroflexi bacterium]|nr:MAG: PPOX class F420-dependent oxidoreductase [Chloroflexota bacterium]
MAETLVSTPTLSLEIRSWLMAELRFPVMATIASDGMPSQSVIWFDLAAGDVVLMNTRVGRIKERHLRRDPRVSLCFEQENDYVTLAGRAELIDDPERGLRDIQALARRYGDDPAAFEGQHRVTILMHVERATRHT